MPNKCQGCDQLSEQIKSLKANAAEQINALKAKVDRLQTEAGAVQALRLEVSQLQQLVVSLQTQMMSSMPELIQKSISAALEIKSKRKNLVLVGLKEEGRDSEAIKKLCEHAEIADDEILVTYRDGRPKKDLEDKGKPQRRIMKIKVKTPAARRKLLDSSKSLRSANGVLAGCYLRPDMTYDERMADRKAKNRLFTYGMEERKTMFIRSGRVFYRNGGAEVTEDGPYVRADDANTTGQSGKE